MLLVIALQTNGDPELLRDWIYPNSSAFAAITNGEAISTVWITGDDLTNVTDWYSDRARMGRTGNPSFGGRSRGLFSHGMSEQTGRIGTRSGTNAATETFLIWRPDRALIVHASWNRGERRTRISITERRGSSASNMLFAPNTLVNALTPPGSVMGSGGQMLNVGAFIFAHTNSLAALSNFWDEPLVWLTNSANAQSLSARSAIALKPVQMVRLSAGVDVLAISGKKRILNAEGREMDLLVIAAQSLSLIHAEESSNNTSQLMIGSIIK
jgi:hypothetical protein